MDTAPRMDAPMLLSDIESRLIGPSPDVPGLPVGQQLARLAHRTEHFIGIDELKVKMESGRPLKVKFGIDPTSAKIHIGHLVVYRKMRQFQRLGHTIQVLIGSFTAMIGDPSDRLAMRQPLSKAQVEENMQTYFQQLGRIIDMDRAERFHNGDWFFNMKVEQFLPLLSSHTVSQMLERESFKLRYTQGTPIGIHEFAYPLLQGYDSVEMHSDVEIGGNDQLFNMLRGRDVQPLYQQEAQAVVAMPLLLGTDGRKMSKSFDNYIALTDAPDVAYGKLLSVPDELVRQYAQLLTDVTDEEWQHVEDALRMGLNPKDVKMLVARLIVGEIHGRDAALAAESAWIQTFSAGGIPADLAETKLTASQKVGSFADLLVSLSLVASKSDARRLFEQGGVKELTGEERKLTADDVSFREGTHVYRVGKKQFVKTSC